jgi:hypothetical protein
MTEQLETPIVVAAYDAGAANHIIEFVRARADGGEVRACMAGPALALWERAFPGTKGNLDPAGAFAGARTLVSGTGWASSFEHDARLLARQLGLEVIAVIDHWTNYRDRFERTGKIILPDQIWVTDEHALALARRFFSGVALVQMPNLYLDRLVREVASLQGQVESPPDHLLYLLEPIRDAWGERDRAGEFDALDFFIGNLGLLATGVQLTIRLRPHPSDPAGKYDQWMQSVAGQNVRLDDEPGLAQSLAWAGTVVGCQTYAMVVALAAGKRVYSSVPADAPACVLPHAGIVKMAEMVSAPSANEKADARCSY